MAKRYYAAPESGRPAAAPHMNGLLPAFRHTTLASLLLPIGRASVWDQWSAREVALFESALCQYGKNFDTVANCVGSKNTHEVIEFYYVRLQSPLRTNKMERFGSTGRPLRTKRRGSAHSKPPSFTPPRFFRCVRARHVCVQVCVNEKNNQLLFFCTHTHKITLHAATRTNTETASFVDPSTSTSPPSMMRICWSA